MYFTVEEENLICLYHNADRRRTAANLRAAFCAIPAAQNTSFSSFCRVSAVFSTKKVSWNIRSFRLCKVFSSSLASCP